MKTRLPPAAPLLVVVLSACAPAAHTATTAAPVPAAVETRVDSIFAHFGPTTPGCAAGVYRAGEIVFAKGYGMANLEHGIPITPETVFDIASNSKQFTAFAIHLLARQGRLSLDDDVRKHIPELPEFGSVTTLRHMIHNSSGLRDFGNLRWLSQPGWTNEHPITRTETMELLTRQRTLSFPTGERYIYSTTNWILLAMVVERVDGRAFRDFMEQEVFRPLGMERTVVRDDPTRIVPGRVATYTPLDGGGYRINFTWGLTSDLGGTGNIHTTLGDLARWDANFYDERLGGAGITEAMYTPGALTSGVTTRYAAGLIVGGRHRGLEVIGHGGAGGGSSELIRFPEQRLSVAVLCNQQHDHTPSHEYAKRVADIFLPPTDPVAAPTVSPTGPAVVLAPEELGRFAGRFIYLESGVVSEFVVQEGVLVEKDGLNMYPLMALGDGRFEDDAVHIEFSADAVEATVLSKLAGDPFRLRRLDGEVWKPSPSDLAAYRGAYVSDELDVTWEVLITDDVMALQRRGAPEVALQPVVPDRFRTNDEVLITFVRDADGAVTGLSVSTPRALNMEFSRTLPPRVQESRGTAPLSQTWYPAGEVTLALDTSRPRVSW